MNRFRAIIVIGLLLAAVQISPAQKFFLFEQPKPFKHPVQLPPGALQVLRREISTRRGCNLTESSNISKWFIASRISLGANRRAYIARSYKNCLNGADNDWFWIVLRTRAGYRLLLHGGSVSLTVHNRRTRGFPDLEANTGTGAGMYADVYKFDGTVYKLDSCWFTDSSTKKRRPSPNT